MSANTNAVETPEVAPVKLFPSRSEAEANKPAEAAKSLRVFELLKAGKSLGYLWARSYESALSVGGRMENYSVTAANSKPISKEAVAAKLAELTDDELAAMGLSRSKKPAKK